jgi:hypothetical protein
VRASAPPQSVATPPPRTAAHLLRQLRARNTIASRPIEQRCKVYGRWLLLAGCVVWLLTFVTALGSDDDPSPLRAEFIGLSIVLFVFGGIWLALSILITAALSALYEMRADIPSQVSDGVGDKIETAMVTIADLSYVDGASSMEAPRHTRGFRPHGRARKS